MHTMSAYRVAHDDSPKSQLEGVCERSKLLLLRFHVVTM